MLDYWLRKLTKLRVDRATQNPAPHKPLLILAILDQIEQGIIKSNIVLLTPELAFQFLGYWEIVSARGRSVGHIELPFFYLQSDGFLKHVAIKGLEAALGSIRPTSIDLINKVISHAVLAEDFFLLMLEKSNRDEARKTLISGDWFLPHEKLKLISLLGLNLELNDNFDKEKVKNLYDDDDKKGRDIKFRFQIIPLYRYSCILCGIKMLLPSGIALVEAAHIHQFSNSKNDDISNGLALCRNHHWAFDQGLWSIGKNLEVLVADNMFFEQSPNQIALKEYHSIQINFSWIPPEYRPSQKHLEWHRKQKFIG